MVDAGGAQWGGGKRGEPSALTSSHCTMQQTRPKQRSECSLVTHDRVHYRTCTAAHTDAIAFELTDYNGNCPMLVAVKIQFERCTMKRAAETRNLIYCT